MPGVNTLLMVACVALVLAFKRRASLGVGVRHRRDRHDGDHLDAVLRGGARRAGAGVARAASLVVAVPDRRPGVLRGEPRQDHAAAAGCRWRSALVVFTLMSTWKRGRRALAERLRRRRAAARSVPAGPRDAISLPRVPGTAVFMTLNPDGVPPALLHHFKHNKSLHEQVILLSIITEHVPGVRRARARRDVAISARASITWSRTSASCRARACRTCCASSGA